MATVAIVALPCEAKKTIDESSVATVHFVNELSSFRRLFLQNDQRKNVKRVKYNAQTKPVYLLPGATAFQISARFNSEVVIGAEDLPSSVAPNHTYHVIASRNELDQIDAFTIDLENSVPEPDKVRIIFVDAVGDSPLDLSINNVDTTSGLTYGSTFTYESTQGAIAFTTKAPALPVPIIVHNNYVHSFAVGRTYVVVLGGTADDTDGIRSAVNIYPDINKD